MASRSQPAQERGSEPSNWEKATTLSTIFISVTVPVILAFLGWRYTANIESESVRKDFVGIAVAILAEPIPEAKLVSEGEPNHAVTENDVERDRHLRDWAVDILEEASPVAIPDDMAGALRAGSEVLSDSAAPAGPNIGESMGEASTEGPASSSSADRALQTGQSNTNHGSVNSSTVAVPNLFAATRSDAVQILRRLGFVVNDFEVCSSSVAAGQVRQVLNGDETVVYVDIAGTTADGRSVPAGSLLAVKIGDGTSC